MVENSKESHCPKAENLTFMHMHFSKRQQYCYTGYRHKLTEQM